jgi:hypothetical protein
MWFAGHNGRQIHFNRSNYIGIQLRILSRWGKTRGRWRGPSNRSGRRGIWWWGWRRSCRSSRGGILHWGFGNWRFRAIIIHRRVWGTTTPKGKGKR